MPKLVDHNGLIFNRSYVIEMTTILSDFEMLKHAFFTDPKD